MPSVAPLRSESEFVSEREALHRGKSWIMLAGWNRDILTSGWLRSARRTFRPGWIGEKGRPRPRSSRCRRDLTAVPVEAVRVRVKGRTVLGK